MFFFSLSLFYFYYTRNFRSHIPIAVLPFPFHCYAVESIGPGDTRERTESHLHFPRYANNRQRHVCVRLHLVHHRHTVTGPLFVECTPESRRLSIGCRPEALGDSSSCPPLCSAGPVDRGRKGGEGGANKIK